MQNLLGSQKTIKLSAISQKMHGIEYLMRRIDVFNG